MILRIIIIGAVLIAVYRFMGGKTPLIDKKEGKKGSRIDPEALEECSKCGTYVSSSESISSKGKLYCSKECLPD